MIGIPEFVKAKKTERSLAQNAGSIALRTIPRSTLALLRETTKMLDGLITRLVPGSYQTVVKTTGAVGTGVMIGAVLPAVSMFDGGITAISLIAANKLGPKGAALLSPEKRAKIDKAVLDKLAYIHSIGDMACGKDQGVYAQQMDLYTDYAVKREKHKVIETLDALARDTNKAGRDQFFGPEMYLVDHMTKTYVIKP
jgi:hypothetical protein